VKETFDRAMAFLDAGIAEREREREAERAAAEAALAAERERLEHQAQVQHMRAEAAQRLTHRTRLAALAWAWIALIAIGLGVFGWYSAVKATNAERLAQAAQRKAASEQLEAEAQAKNARTQSERATAASATATKAKQVALAQKGEALKQRAEAERQKRVADSERGVAQAQTSVAVRERGEAVRERGEAVRESAAAAAQETIANAQRRVAETQRSAVFMQSGREALLSGEDDNAAVLLAAAYTHDPNNPALALILRQALDKLKIRAGSFVAQGDTISALAFNPANAHQFVTASDDGSALWDSTGHLLHRFDDQEVITAVAFDPAGRHLVTAGADGSAKIRDLNGITPASARPPLALKGHTRRINSVEFSHDGSRVLTAGSDGKVREWATASGELVGDFGAGTSTAYDARFTPDDKLIVTGWSDGTVRVLDAHSGSVVESLPVAQNSAVLHVAVGPGGRRIAAGTIDGSVLIYDIVAKKQLALRHDDDGTINAIGFDATGARLLTGSDSGSALLIDVTSGASTPLLPSTGGEAVAHVAAIQTALFSPSGNWIATTYADGMVRLWTSAGVPVAGFLQGGRGGRAVAAAFDGPGDTLVTGGTDGRVAVWHPPTLLVPADAAQTGAIDAISIDRKGDELLTASHDGTATLWRLGDPLTRLRTFAHAPGVAWVAAARFNADGSRILTAGGSAVKVWSVNGTLLATIPASAANKHFSDATFVGNQLLVAERTFPQGNLAGVKDHWRLLSPDGKSTLLTQPDWENEIRTLQVSADDHVLTVTSLGEMSYDALRPNAKPVYDSYVTAASVSHHHPYYALGWANGAVGLVTPGQASHTFSGGEGRVTATAFSSDDRWLASAGADDRFGKVWDVERLRLHATLRGHQGEITSIAFSPGSGAFVLTTSADGTAKLWDRDSGGQLASASVPGSQVRSARFTPDAREVVIGAANGSVYLWHVGGAPPAAGTTARAVLAASAHNGNNTDLLLTQALQTLEAAAKGGR
jgi:WD40 repeat protein